MIDAILDHWGGARAVAELKNRENRIFDVTLTDGTRAALRLHRPGYQTKSAITSELSWMAQIADLGFPCPVPIPTHDGQVLVDHQGQIASVIRWIDGNCIGEMGAATGLSPRDHCDLYVRIGQMLAQLHTITDRIDGTHIQRSRWDDDTLLGDNPAWGRFWENPALSPDEQTIMRTACDAARDRIRDFHGAGFGLIHADALQENILQSGDQLWLIDFDDGGFGYRLYDAGVAVVQHFDCAYFPDLLSAMAAGFGAPADDIHFFMALRACASAGWAVPRMTADHPAQRVYAERGLAQAKWLLAA